MDDSHFTITFPFTTHTATLLGASIALAIFIWFVMRPDAKDADMAATKRELALWRRTINENYVLIIVICAALVFGWAFFNYIMYIPSLIHHVFDLLREATNHGARESADNVRSYAYAFAALAGALAIFATIPFQLIKVWVNERSARVSEQTLVVDQILKATDQLAAVEEITLATGDTISAPNPTVRAGGIYGLLHVADTYKDRVKQVVFILTAFIESCTRRRGTALGTPTPWSFKNKLSADLHVAICITSSLTGKITFSGTQRLDLNHLHLHSSFVDQVWFKRMSLRASTFEMSRLQTTVIDDCDLTSAFFSRAELRDCRFVNGTNFFDAEFVDTCLWKTRFSEDCNITQIQLDQMYGHVNCTIPANLMKPDHWDDQDISEEQHMENYRNWLSERDSYIPPQDRA